jgi:hypothetical protein
MVDFKRMVNRDTLMSHAGLYGGRRSVDDIVGRSTCIELFQLLSTLSSAPNAEKRFRHWACRYLPAPHRHLEYAAGHAVFSRQQTLQCWKILLGRRRGPEGRKSRYELLGVLHELFAKVNDREVTETAELYFIKASIHYEREQPAFKCYRTQMIWLSDPRLKPYVEAFEKAHGFDLECYVNVLLAIADRCHSAALAADFIANGDCGIDLHAVSRGLGIGLDVLVRMMKTVSFTLDEGAEFAARTLDEPDDVSLFRNAPFLRVSDTSYLPVDQKFVEELLFENLYFRIQAACGGGRKFQIDFGFGFEAYIQHLVAEFCEAKKQMGYLHIEEFAYGKSQNKSPDAMIFCASDNSLVSVEAKSARYLDSILSSDDDADAIEKSFHKLRYGPWEQVNNAVQKMHAAGAHPKIRQAASHAFLVVTMNEIPLALRDDVIDVDGKDVSHCFYAMGVGAFEMLLAAADLANDFTVHDILRNAFHERERMSAKTFIARLIKSADRESSFLRGLQERSTQRWMRYFASA